MKIIKAKTLYAIALLALVMAHSSLQAATLKEHSASYYAQIKKGVTLKGKAIRSLKKNDDGSWTYDFKVKSMFADINESAKFNLINGRLKTVAYDYELSPFLAKNRYEKLRFDWDHLKVISRLKKAPWQISNIPENTYDRLTYQLQLLLDFANSSKHVEYQVAHKKKLRQSVFEYLGDELVETNLGFAVAQKITKVREPDSLRKTVFWVSKKYPLILLKLYQREKNGDEYEILIKSAQIEGEPIRFYDSEQMATEALQNSLNIPAQKQKTPEPSPVQSPNKNTSR